MTATYVHTQKQPGFTRFLLRFLAVLYFLCLAGSMVYLWHFAQNQYTSIASFKISQQKNAAEIGLAQMVLPGLADSGSADSLIAIGYIDSADLLFDLEKEFNLIEHYTSPANDPIFRLDPDDTLEERLDFYRRHISAHFNKESALTMIHVDTFDPKLSLEIADHLLEKAEAFINCINQEIADQQLDFIRSELKRSVEQVDEANQQILALQNEHRFIDPDQAISYSVSAVRDLQTARMHKEAELATILRDSPESPKIESLRSEIRSTNELLDIEIAKLSGPEQDRLNQVLIEFRQLQQQLCVCHPTQEQRTGPA